MKTSSRPRSWLLVPAVFAVMAISFPVAAQDVRKVLAQQIDLAEKRAKAGPDSDESWKMSKPDLLDDLTDARTNLAAGRIFLAVAQTGEATIDLDGLEDMTGHPDIVSGGLLAFDKEWERNKPELANYELRYKDARWDGKPAALRALSEFLLSQARVEYDAGAPYAAATRIPFGLYFIGRGRGAAEFAVLCPTLNLNTTKSPPRDRSIRPELQALQTRVIAAYQPPASIDHHNEFIQINAAIKAAKELDSAKSYFGSLYMYLKAVQLFAELSATTPAAREADQLAAKAAKLHKSLAKASDDESVGEFLLQKAEAAIEKGRGGKAVPSNLKTASVIVETVIPAYLEALRNPLPAAAPGSHVINLTLVRWPYT